MNDLLKDTADGRDSDLEMGPSSSSASRSPPAPGQDTAQFFLEINDVISSMDELRKRLYKLQTANEDYRQVTRASAMKVIKEKMDQDLAEINVIAGELRGKLETLDRSNAANREIINCQAGSSTDRIRMSTTSNVKTRLRDLTAEFQELGQRFQDEHREFIQRRLVTVTGQNVDESVIERLLETGDSEPIFQNAVLLQGRGEVLDTMAEIQERHVAVKDLERKLLELHQTFLDMGIQVVEPQGEPLGNIEPEVRNPVEQGTAGTAQLQKARALRNRFNMCLCIFIIFWLLVAAIIVVTAIQLWKKHTKRPD